MRYFFSISIFLIGFVGKSQQPPFNNSYEISGVIDAFGNIIYENNSYYTCGIISYGSTGKYYLIELDNNGDTIRTKIHAETDKKYLLGFKSLIKDDSSFIFAGTIQDTSGNHPYVVKLNMNFDTIWTSKSWNLPNGYFHSLIQNNNEYVFGGTIENGVSPNLFDFYIVKSDSNGNLLNQIIIPGTDNEAVYSIDTTNDGGFILAGYKDNTITSWNIYVVKTDSAGNVALGWPKVFGGPESDAGWAKTCKNGDYIVWGGWNSPVNQPHLRRLDQNGNTIWFNNYQNAGSSSVVDEFSDLIELENGDFVLCGYFYDSTINNPVGFMLRTDSLGNEKWRRKLQKRSNDNYLYSIAQTPDGGFVMSGNVFPDGSGNTQDGWIIKVDSMGCLTPGCAVGIEELLIDDVGLLIYPNPNDGKFVVEIESAAWAVAGDRRQEEMWVLITDIFGRVVYEKIVNRNSQKFELDISEQAKGIYFLSLITDEKRITSKIIKE